MPSCEASSRAIFIFTPLNRLQCVTYCKFSTPLAVYRQLLLYQTRIPLYKNYSDFFDPNIFFSDLQGALKADVGRREFVCSLYTV